MEKLTTEKYEVRVPVGEGHLIGDLLRKYATRSVSSWQVIGYKVDSHATNFGFSNGATVSYLELLKGVLVCVSEPSVTGPKLYSLAWNGECFAGDGFELYGLNRGVGETVTACILYDKGYRTAEQNFETYKSVSGDDVNGFFAVPSSHSVVKIFRYSVRPCDSASEWLQIEADPGVASAAHNLALNTLKGIDI